MNTMSHKKFMRLLVILKGLPEEERLREAHKFQLLCRKCGHLEEAPEDFFPGDPIPGWRQNANGTLTHEECHNAK